MSTNQTSQTQFPVLINEGAKGVSFIYITSN